MNIGLHHCLSRFFAFPSFLPFSWAPDDLLVTPLAALTLMTPLPGTAPVARAASKPSSLPLTSNCLSCSGLRDFRKEGPLAPPISLSAPVNGDFNFLCRSKQAKHTSCRGRRLLALPRISVGCKRSNILVEVINRNKPHALHYTYYALWNTLLCCTIQCYASLLYPTVQHTVLNHSILYNTTEYLIKCRLSISVPYLGFLGPIIQILLQRIRVWRKNDLTTPEQGTPPLVTSHLLTTSACNAACQQRVQRQ